MEDARVYKIALTMIEGVGPISAKHLISYCGGAEAVFKEKRSALLQIPNIGPVAAAAIGSTDAISRAAKEVAWIDKQGVQLHYFLDEDYPARLRRVEDSPIVLYYKGNSPLNHHRTVGIVGTRKPTEYGLLMCDRLVNGLQPYDIQVISGLAYGIDSAAHQASVQHRVPTIGITGHGLDRIYPAQNRKLADRMIEHGGILTQFPSGTNPDRENFPMRNKVIAAMSDVVIVVESKRKGGSIITAEMANDYNKDVFAIPGKVNDEVSEGCNRLIKINKAHLLESAADVGYIMRWEELDAQKAVQTSLFVDLDPKEEKIVSAIRDAKTIDIDTLCYRTGMTGSEMAGILLGLEFKSVVRGLPGKRYVLR